METKEKRNSGLVVVIILLVIALLGSVGYIVYDKVLMKDKESNNVEDENDSVSNQKHETITYKEAINFIKGNSNQSVLINLINREDKNVTDIKKYANDLPNQSKLVLYGMDYDNTFTSEELKENINKQFGLEVNYLDEDIKCGCGEIRYIYNKDTKTYSTNPNHGGHGGTDVNPYFNISDFKEEDNIYELFIKKGLFLSDESGRGYNLYKTNDDIDTKKVFLDYDNYRTTTDYEIPNWDYVFESHPELLEQLNTYKYTFTKENGKIKLISYEIVK